MKKVFTNGDGSSVGVLYIVSNDLELNSLALYDLYNKRWSIELYHKNIKNHASLSKSPAKTVKSQSKSYLHEYFFVLQARNIKKLY